MQALRFIAALALLTLVSTALHAQEEEAEPESTTSATQAIWIGACGLALSEATRALDGMEDLR